MTGAPWKTTRWLSDARIPPARYQLRSTSTLSCEVDVDERARARSRAPGRARRRRSRRPSRRGAASPSMYGRLALAGRRVRAPHAEPVILRVDPVELEPLDAFRWPSKSRPTDPSALATARTSAHSSPRVGGGVERAGLSAARRTRRGGRRAAASSAAALAAISSSTSRTATMVTPRALPRMSSGFPAGIGSANRARAARAPARAPRSLDERPDQPRGRSRASSRRAPGPTPSCVSTIPPGRSVERREHRRCALSPRQSCVSIVQPTSSSPCSRASSAVKSAELPPRNPPARRRDTPCSRAPSSARFRSASTASRRALADGAGARTHAPRRRGPPSSTSRQQLGLALHPLPEHEERRA